MRINKLIIAFNALYSWGEADLLGAIVLFL